MSTRSIRYANEMPVNLEEITRMAQALVLNVSSYPNLRHDPDISELASMISIDEQSALLKKLGKDLTLAASLLTDKEARYLVDLYYAIQKLRIMVGGQIGAIERQEQTEPNEFLVYFQSSLVQLENQVKVGLGKYAFNSPNGQWMGSICGLGGVISAGLMAHIDIRLSRTAGKLQRFAGIDPTVKWLGAEKARKLVEETIGKRKHIEVSDIFACAIKAGRNPQRVLDAMIAEKDEAIKKFTVTDASLKVLSFELPEDVINGLTALKDELYQGEINFLGVVERAIGYSNVELFKSEILKATVTKDVKVKLAQFQGQSIKNYLLAKFNYRCAYCNLSALDRVSLEVDFALPASRGGSSEVNNLVISCQSCIQLKGTQTADEFGHPEVTERAKEQWSYGDDEQKDQLTFTRAELIGQIAKRPWNASLKTLAIYKLGESFVKVHNNPNDYYGKLYAARKVREIAYNNEFRFKEQALQALEEKTYRNKEIQAIYESGKLPPGHIHARARRYAVQIFLSHLHYVMFYNHYGVEPPVPYPMAFMNHTDMIYPPNLEVIGLSVRDYTQWSNLKTKGRQSDPRLQ